MPLARPRLFALLSCLAWLLVAPRASAQTSADNVAKYHALRQRLLSEFTVVGSEPGQSQPADLRDDGEGFIKWADSTIRLGWYLSVLATEHHIVSNPDRYPGAAGPEQTLDELYYALLALERLDQVADASFPPPCTQTPALNGFFIRDDVPDGFHANFPPLTITYSDFVDPELTNKEMSQDQVYHVLMGLAAVKVFVADDVVVNGKPLRAWAIEQGQRIIEHVAKDNWVIKNPACNREVNRGPLASGFSAGTQHISSFLTDGAFVPDTQEVLKEAWQKASETSFPAYLDIDNLHMAMTIAAVGNGWGDTTADALATLGQAPDWPLYGLLHRALHADVASGFCRTAAELNPRARAMLDELPAGADIASPEPAPLAPHGFTRSNRFMRGKETAYTGEPGSEGYRFNGLDYMLLHNLYAIATPSTWEGGNGPGVPECQEPSDAGTSDAGSAGTSGTGGASASPSNDDESGCGCRMAGERGRAKSILALLLALGAIAGWRVGTRNP